MSQRSESTPTAGSAIGRRRATARNATNSAYHERRAEIVAAAAEVFNAKGFRGTTLSDIAEATGADRASLYYYIGSKAELLDEVVTGRIRKVLTDAERVSQGEGDAPTKLHQLITELVTSYETEYPFLYVYLQENLAHVARSREKWSHEVRQINRKWEAAVEAILVQGIEEGTLRPVVDTRIMLYGLSGMLGWTNRWFNPHTSPYDAKIIGEAYADMLLRGMTT